MSLEIKDIMVTKTITVQPETSLKDAINLMNTYEIGCLVVTKDGCPVGIITERDLLKKVLSNFPKLEKIKVQEVMSTPVKTGKPDTELEYAASFMVEHRIKKLPITDEGKLVGLITLTDILRFQPQLIKVYKIFSSDVVPTRIKKVFDYYLLLHPESRDSSPKNMPLRLQRK